MYDKWTTEEENAVADFRKRMMDEVPKYMYEDKFVFYKFLKARNFNQQQAESMLRKHLVWRKAIQIDTIIADIKPSEVLQKYISQTCFGFSKDGYLLQYAAIGNADGKGLFKTANHIDVLRCILQEIEKNLIRLKLHSEKIGRTVNQCIYIYDMENMTLAKATHKSSIELFAFGIAMFQDNYPELLKNLYVINASVYFTIAFPIVKAILSGAVLDKIKVYGKDGWKEELLRVIDAEVLPAFLGGNRTDPDGNPLCNTIVNHVGPIPEHYYLTKNIELIQQRPNCRNLSIDRQKSTNVSVDVAEPGSIINWEFETKHYDIGFGLFKKQSPDSNEFIELIPVHKMETDNSSETGMYTCKSAGTYIIVFDNSYSWFHSKEVYYRTWVTRPTQEDLEKDYITIEF